MRPPTTWAQVLAAVVMLGAASSCLHTRAHAVATPTQPVIEPPPAAPVTAVLPAPAGTQASPGVGDDEHDPPELPAQATDPSASDRSDDGERLRAEYEKAPARMVLKGKAVFYHDSLAGNLTASGEPYEPGLYTAAHRDLPLGTIVRVIGVESQRDVYVRINDRGPFGRRDYIIDLSRAAAEELGLTRTGVALVRVEVLKLGKAAKAGKRKGHGRRAGHK